MSNHRENSKLKLYWSKEVLTTFSRAGRSSWAMLLPAVEPWSPSASLDSMKPLRRERAVTLRQPRAPLKPQLTPGVLRAIMEMQELWHTPDASEALQPEGWSLTTKVESDLPLASHGEVAGGVRRKLLVLPSGLSCCLPRHWLQWQGKNESENLTP